MAELKIDLPDALLAYIESQVATGYFADAGALVSHLLEIDQRDNGRLRELIAEGERSGMSELSFDEIVERARERAESRAA